MSYRSRSYYANGKLTCRNIYYLSFKSLVVSFIVKIYANFRDIVNSRDNITNYINLKIHELLDAKNSFIIRNSIFVNNIIKIKIAEFQLLLDIKIVKNENV